MRRLHVAIHVSRSNRIVRHVTAWRHVGVILLTQRSNGTGSWWNTRVESTLMQFLLLHLSLQLLPSLCHTLLPILIATWNVKWGVCSMNRLLTSTKLLQQLTNHFLYLWHISIVCILLIASVCINNVVIIIDVIILLLWNNTTLFIYLRSITFYTFININITTNIVIVVAPVNITMINRDVWCILLL